MRNGNDVVMPNGVKDSPRAAILKYSTGLTFCWFRCEVTPHDYRRR